MHKDEDVEKAILTLVEQISKLRNYEQEAWQDFKDIARVLDDKKAREHFYRVDGVWRNVQEIQRYIEGDFSNSFDRLVEQVTQKVQTLIAQCKHLRNVA
jgi:predicted RecB family endonuclease